MLERKQGELEQVVKFWAINNDTRDLDNAEVVGEAMCSNKFRNIIHLLTYTVEQVDKNVNNIQTLNGTERGTLIKLTGEHGTTTARCFRYSWNYLKAAIHQ